MAFSSLLAKSSRPQRTFCAALMVLLAILQSRLTATGDPNTEGISTREAKLQAIQSVPFKQLSQQTGQALRDVLDSPSFYRRMPTQTIQCDPELFTLLVRKPEIMVNTWDLMGITKVTAKRTGPFTFLANDGVGTKCKCDLVYGDDKLHIYYGSGDYDGTMTPRSVKGRAVCILRSDTQAFPQGHSGHMVRGTMDVFLKFDNLGADLITRTFGPLVAKTADHNFAETAQFVSQLSQVCATNPAAVLALAGQLDDVDENVRHEFTTIAMRMGEAKLPAARVRPEALSADSRAVAQTLEELKVATNVNVPPMISESSSTSRSSGRTQPLPASDPTSVELTLSDSNSARKPIVESPSTGNSIARPNAQIAGAITQTSPTTRSPSGLQSNSNQTGPPAPIYPKKQNITMRR